MAEIRTDLHEIYDELFQEELPFDGAVAFVKAKAKEAGLEIRPWNGSKATEEGEIRLIREKKEVNIEIKRSRGFLYIPGSGTDFPDDHWEDPSGPAKFYRTYGEKYVRTLVELAKFIGVDPEDLCKEAAEACEAYAAKRAEILSSIERILQYDKDFAPRIDVDALSVIKAGEELAKLIDLFDGKEREA